MIVEQFLPRDLTKMLLSGDIVIIMFPFETASRIFVTVGGVATTISRFSNFVMEVS